MFPAISQTVLRQMPPGISPPMIVNYDASTVPVLQLALSGKGLDEQQLFDLGLNQIRPQLVTVPGVAMPFPSGGDRKSVVSGKSVSVRVDLGGRRIIKKKKKEK